MESKKLEKAEALRIAALQKEVKELKDALEMQNIKEQIVAEVLQTQDKGKLEQIVKAVQNVLNPLDKAKDRDATAEQGNK